MERLSVHQKNTKQAKAKKTPIKVVHISNPRKVKASPAEFRNLVQELTGQDSNVADFSKFPDVEDTGDLPPPPPEPTSGATGTPRPSPVVHRTSDPCHNAFRNLPSPFEMIDEAFDLQMLENIPGFLPSIAAVPRAPGSWP
ncbi:uncharacterized protein LOC103705024 [Phoenix dactylifera]|uniref:Uncharacterized protein LOC103705024 n=1 Tax=Phoenix dactylifera TaxID=42345 RepID=A0A8B7BWI6_PHODC|nr:uncharacterized protein LOC103705024 [Phoenix dactylifera]